MAELKVGDAAPEFRLKADDGREVTLQGLRGKRIVLYFFPKVLTPGCSTEAAEFRDAKPEFDKLETLVFGCSADPVESQDKFKSKFKLNFTLLSNPDFTVIEAYGARRMKSFLGTSFVGNRPQYRTGRTRWARGEIVAPSTRQRTCRGSCQRNFRSARVAPSI
jgi:peroxiredoxin Q/BCP